MTGRAMTDSADGFGAGPGSEAVDFDADFAAAGETDADGHVAQLMNRINACLLRPQNQTIGAFSETLQALYAELSLAAGVNCGPTAEQAAIDWAEILAGAAGDTPLIQDVPMLTDQELVALSPRAPITPAV
jgi:hypothetical protein